MGTQRDAHPTVIYTLEGIVDQVGSQFCTCFLLCHDKCSVIVLNILLNSQIKIVFY